MILDRLLNAIGLSRLTLDATAGPTFDVQIDPVIYGQAVIDPWGDVPARVSRAEAISVPAFKRGKDLVCSTIGTLPFRMLDGSNVTKVSPLLEQPERNVARSVTMTRLAEDLLLEGVAWWRVIERNWLGYPTKVVRLEPTTVQTRRDGRTYYRTDGTPQGTAWEWIEDRDLIRFDSPNDAALVAGARAVRTYVRLATAADNYAKDPMPQGYFHPAVPYELEDEEVASALDRWETARQQRVTGYVPQNLAYETVQWNPEQLQLMEARQHAVLEIARVIGVDPEDLGVSTTSRTYANMQDRRLARIQDTLGAYIQAIAERLSMGDVTPRGSRVRADLNGFLRADDQTRLAAYATALGLGIIDVPQILEREELPEPLPARTPDQPAEQLPPPEPVEASMDRSTLAFDADPSPLVFGFDTDATRLAFQVDIEARTITGLAVPYGVPTRKHGQWWQFSKGSLVWGEPSRVKLCPLHDRNAALGIGLQLTDTDTGLWATMKVEDGPEGDRALQKAVAKVWDGLSIGLDEGGTFARRGVVNHAVRVPLAEISLTPFPAFPDARVSQVAASADDPTTKGTVMPCSSCGQIHAPGTPCPTQATTAGTPAPTNPPAEAPAAPPAFDADAFTEQLAQRFGLTPVPAPGDGPEVIHPPSSRPGQVTETLPYTFDRGGNFRVDQEHVFSADLLAMARSGDLEGRFTDAGKRVMGMLATLNPALNFATVTTDINETTPTIQRHDMYVDQRDYRTPLWDMVSKGAPPNGVQPFTFPKFNSASGLVGDHTEGTEPTAGAFTTTGQTVTPTALSGKASLTREVFDMGGNPAVSTLIWNQMVRGYREGLESATATFLNTLTAAADITLTTAAANEALAADWDAAVAELQFVRGYDFSAFAVEKVLYKQFVAAVDDVGRKLFPILSPSNANGTAASRFRTLDLSGVIGVPSWALASTAGSANNSWLFDPTTVSGWATAPQRLEFNAGTDASGDYAPVAMVDIAIWGYKAFANSDIGGVRQVIYDSVS